MPYDFRTTEEDDLLAIQAKSDRRALRRLFDKHHRSTYSLLLGRTRNADEARALNGDLWNEIAQRICEYDPSYAFGCFVVNRLNSVYFRWVREQRRQNSLVSLDDPAQHPHLAKRLSVPGPEEDSSLDAMEEERRYWFLLSSLLSLPHPPHQVIVFIYNKLLDYPCSKIIDELSQRTLGELADMAERQYSERAWLPGSYLRPLFSLFKRCLNLPIGALLHQADVHTKQRLASCIGSPARTLRLRRFFGDNPQSNCNNWVSRVRKALVLTWAGLPEEQGCENVEASDQ